MGRLLVPRRAVDTMLCKDVAPVASPKKAISIVWVFLLVIVLCIRLTAAQGDDSSDSPTLEPRPDPTSEPTPQPIDDPTDAPSSVSPTFAPSTLVPTTLAPSTRLPTVRPTKRGDTVRPSNAPTTKPSKAPVLTFKPSTTPTRSPRPAPTKRPSKSPVPAPSRGPTRSPTLPTPQPTKRPVKTSSPTPSEPTSEPTNRPVRTSSPTFDVTNIDIDEATLSSRMVLTVTFNSPVAFVNSTTPSARPSRRVPCAWVFESPVITQSDGRDVSCRISGNSIVTDAIKTSTFVDYSFVVIKDSTMVAVNAGNTLILRPFSAPVTLDGVLQPVPVIVLQSSSCGNLYISWTESTGSGSKPFTLVHWIVDGPVAQLSLELGGDLDDNMEDMTRTVISRYNVDSRYHGRRFLARLRLTNWLGQSGESAPITIDFSRVTPNNANGNATTAITVVGSPVTPAAVPFGEPQFTLRGPDAPVSLRSDFLLEVSLAFPIERCSVAMSAFVNGTRYPVWELIDGPFPKGFRGIALRGDSFKYMVLAGQLGVGNYVFGAQVSRFQYLQTTVVVTMDAEMNVWGGNRSLNADESAELLLDGAYANGSIASIKWVCTQIPLIAASLDDNNTNTVLDALAHPDFFFQPTQPCSGSINTAINSGRSFTAVIIPASLLALDRVYLIHAELTIFLRGPVLESLPAYLVRTTAVGGFSIQIDYSTQPISGRGKLNVNSPAVIRAQSLERNLRYSWVQMQGDLDEDTLSMLDMRKSSIKFPANTLSPGQRYSFRVSVMNAPNLFATITFVGNDPPAGGFVGVAPSEGFSGLTEFSMQALYFEDEDLPLTYSFVIAKRDCYEEDCFPGKRQSSLFQPLTPFFPDGTAVTKLEYFPQPQSIGCIAQDALGAVSFVVLANTSVSVRKPTRNAEELASDLRQAVGTPEDGSKAWTNILSALSNFNNDSSLSTDDTTPTVQVEPELLKQALQTAQDAASFAPQRMSSLVIENQIPTRIASDFRGVLEQNPSVLESTVKSMGSVLDRAKSVLQLSGGANQQPGNTVGEGDVELLRSLTVDTLASSSQLLDSIALSGALSDVNVSVPRDVVSRLIQVQLAVPSKIQSADQDRFFSSPNIDSSFQARFYDDILNQTNDQDRLSNGPLLLQIQPSRTQPLTAFVLPSNSILRQLDIANASLAFASSVLYRVNPFAREQNAKKQPLLAGGVSSLQVFNGASGEQLHSFETPVQIVMEFGPSSRLNTDLSRELQITRRVNGTNSTMPPRNVTERVFCGFFDFNKGNWSEFGCQVQSVGRGVLTCACNHTTDYTAWVETVQEIVLTFTDVSNFNNIEDGIAVVVVLSLWAVGTVAFLYWGITLDDRDMKRRVRGILFSLKLRRLRDQRVKHRVFRAWRCEVLKQTGAIVDASAPLPPALSSLVSIERRNRVAAQPPPALRVDLSTTPKRMWHFFSVSIFREHTLLNTIFLLDPFLTRPMRVMCGAAVVLGEMFAAAVFYHFDTSDDITIGTQIAVALLSIILVSPVVALFVVLSRRVSAMPGAQRLYLQQMMVVLIAEMGEDRQGDDVFRWANFAKQVTWEDLREIHRFQSMKNRLETLKRQSPQTAESKLAIRALQTDMAEQKQAILNALKKSNPEFADINKQRVSARDVQDEQQQQDEFGLPLSSNTSRWLAKVSSTSASKERRTSYLTSPLNRASKKQQSAGPLLRPKSPRVMNTAFTPRPFHVATPHERSQDEEEDEDFRVRTRNCLRKVFVRPVFYLLRARPTSWYRTNLPPPDSDFYLGPRWIYVAYFILFLYYALALFFVLSWGFRSKNEAVLNWLPTVALSIFIDLFLLQPFLIFVRFALMNELAYRMDERDFVSMGYTGGDIPGVDNPDAQVKLLVDDAMNMGTQDEPPAEDDVEGGMREVSIEEPRVPSQAPPRPARSDHKTLSLV